MIRDLTGEMIETAVATAYGRRSYYHLTQGDAEEYPYSTAFDGIAATLRATGSLDAITGKRLMNGIEGALGGPWTYESHPNDQTRAVWDAAAADVRARLEGGG